MKRGIVDQYAIFRGANPRALPLHWSNKMKTEKMREILCALDGFNCEKKPDSHNCRETCWAFADLDRAKLEGLLSDVDPELLKIYEKENPDVD